jgi:dipeptide/tripeptide permease
MAPPAPPPAPASEDAPSPEGLGAQLRSLGTTYWLANAMEMLERLAYYGLRTVLPIYMVLAVEEGGPQFSHLQKATVFFWWAAVQSFVPILSGGFADRFGYKRTVGVSIGIKVAGYLLMAWAVELGLAVSGGASAGVPGHPAVLGSFLAGSLLLALGTATFKPGLQGIIATQIRPGNASLAWSVFYQLVNLGGFLGPLLAGVLRVLDWRYVFLSCALIVSLNYFLLLTFAEPDRPRAEGPAPGVWTTLTRSAEGILEPRLFAFLATFSGFWAMFYQLFDLLPNYIDDWVDSRDLFAGFVTPLFALAGSSPPEGWGGQVPQEMMINLNSGLIMIFAFAVGFWTGKIRSMTAMIAGIVVSAGGIYSLGLHTSGAWILLSIGVFSLGEMMASPTKIRYFSAIAPPDKKALYLGYINATSGIGWSLGSLLAGSLYEEGGDKVALARRHLIERMGASPDEVAAIPKTEVLGALAARLELSPDAAQALLHQTWQPQQIWWWFTAIGLVSMAGLVAFDQITRRAGPREAWALTAVTALVTGICYGWPIGLWFGAHMALRELIGGPRVARLVLAEAALGVLWSLRPGA